MYKDTRYYEEIKTIQISFPLNKNAFIGFCIGTPLVLGLICLLYFLRDIEPDPRAIEYNYVPVVLLNFGSGDGTGQSKGNLTEEGIAYKGQIASELHDAEKATTTRRAEQESITDPTQSSNIQPKKELSSTSKTEVADAGSSSKNIGIADGSIDGSGLGNRGRGLGLGDGFGEIEWGGGGNRIVLSKMPPKFPTGNVSGDIKLRFTVRPDGTISRILVLKKADPALENAAITALRQWRFNPIKDTVDMEGIIPFRFKLR